MTEIQIRQRRASGLWQLWDRLVRVDTADEVLERDGRIFNILMVLNVCATLSIALAFLGIRYVGGFEDFPASLAIPFPLLFTVLAAWWIWLAKRGQVVRATRIYVWFNFAMSALAAIVFDGFDSPAFAGFTWSIVVAGTLISPPYALVMLGCVVGLFVLLLAFQTLGIYAPLFVTGAAHSVTFALYNLIMLIFGTGLVTYINMGSLQDALARLRRTGKALEEERATLEERVAAGVQRAEYRSRQFEAVMELQRRLGTYVEPSALLREAVTSITDQLGVEHAAIFLLRDTADQLSLEAVASETESEALPGLLTVPVGTETLVGSVAATGRPRLIHVEGPTSGIEQIHLPGSQVEAALPLAARGRLVGVLDLQSRNRDAISPEDLMVLRVLADGLAISLDNTRLLIEAQSSLEQLERYQDEESVAAWRIALARRRKELAYQYDRLALTEVAVDEGALPVSTFVSHTLQQVDQDGRHFLLAPVRVRERLIGMLTFEAARPWSRREEELAESVVGQLSLALENARLLEDTRLSAQQERARSEIVGQIRASVQMDAILRSAAQELGRALQVERARVQLVSLPDGSSGNGTAAEQEGQDGT